LNKKIFLIDENSHDKFPCQNFKFFFLFFFQFFFSKEFFVIFIEKQTKKFSENFSGFFLRNYMKTKPSNKYLSSENFSR